MSFKDPKAVTETGTEKGAEKARLSWDRALVAGFLAGAYIAFGGLLAIVVTAGMNPDIWGGLQTFFMGAVFSLGLVLVVIAGSELLTGNMALVPLAAFRGRATIRQIFENFTWVLVGNLVGALFVAYVLADQTGVVSGDPAVVERLTELAQKKGVEETEKEIFLRAVGCNWLVCLAVWMAFAAEDVAGKILAIFFPIMAFVAMGFDHVVANMFFLPAAIMAGADLTWWDTAHNWIFAFLGNLVGAAIFVAGAYWYLYGRSGPAAPDAGDEPADPGESGRSSTLVDGDGAALTGGASRAPR